MNTEGVLFELDRKAIISWLLKNQFIEADSAPDLNSEEECKLLKDAGCDIIQGYYFSKPIAPEEFEKFKGNNKCY